MGLAVVGLLLTATVAGGLWLRRERFLQEMGWTGVFIALCFALGLVPVLGVLRRYGHQGIVVVWCRRFGAAETHAGARNRWLWGLVTEASKDIAYPVTLQDASIQGAQSVGRSVQTPLSIAGLVLGIPLWLLLVLWLYERMQSTWLEWLVFFGSLALYIGIFMGMGRLAVWVVTSLASIRGRPEVVQRKLLGIKRCCWAWQEMEVIRCTDEDWQAQVESLLDVVNCTIIDCTESSEPLAWEIELAQHRLGKDEVLLVSAEGSALANGCQASHIAFDEQRAQDEIATLSQTWGTDDYGEGRVTLGPYGQELVAQLRTWMEGRTDRTE